MDVTYQVEWWFSKLPSDLWTYIVDFLKPQLGLCAHRRLLQGDPHTILENLAHLISDSKYIPSFPIYHPILYRKDRYFVYDLVDTYLPYMDLNEIMVRFIVYLCTKYHYRLNADFVQRYHMYFKYIALPVRYIRGFRNVQATTCETTCWYDTR